MTLNFTSFKHNISMNIFTIDSYTLYYLLDCAIGKIRIIGSELYLNNGLNEPFDKAWFLRNLINFINLNTYQ